MSTSNEINNPENEIEVIFQTVKKVPQQVKDAIRDVIIDMNSFKKLYGKCIGEMKVTITKRCGSKENITIVGISGIPSVDGKEARYKKEFRKFCKKVYKEHCVIALPSIEAFQFGRSESANDSNDNAENNKKLAEEIAKRMLWRIDEFFTGQSRMQIVQLLQNPLCPWGYTFVEEYGYTETDLKSHAKVFMDLSYDTEGDKNLTATEKNESKSYDSNAKFLLEGVSFSSKDYYIRRAQIILKKTAFF